MINAYKKITLKALSYLVSNQFTSGSIGSIPTDRFFSLIEHIFILSVPFI